MSKSLVSLGLVIFILGALDQLAPVSVADRVIDSIAMGLSLIIIVLGLRRIGSTHMASVLPSTKVVHGKTSQQTASDHVSDSSDYGNGA